MRPSCSLTVPPLFAEGACFCGHGEDPRIEYLLPKTVVEMLAVGVLVVFARSMHVSVMP
jgi:hypothetical protein